MDTYTNCLLCTKSHGRASVSLVEGAVQNALKWHSLLVRKKHSSLKEEKMWLNYTFNRQTISCSPLVFSA